MGSKKASSGGKAEAAGGNYETLVAAWYCTRLLLGRVAPSLFDLPASARIIAIACQSNEHVDDVNCDTSDSGKIFVQAKRSVSLSEQETSPLGKAFKQFVQQYRTWTHAGASAGTRVLDISRDRLVLATRSGRSRKIVEMLPRMLRALRDQSNQNLLSDVQTSEQEREVALTIEGHIKRNWVEEYEREPSPSEVGSILRFVWIQTLDVEEGERDRADALGLMRAAVLADAAQADSAFSELVRQCARLRAERSGTDVPALQATLARVGVRLTALPDYRADIEALRKWTAVQVQKAPRFTRLLESTPNSMLEREIWPTFRDGATAQSFLVVGDPGAGKSGLTYRLTAYLVGSGTDVVFIPVDILNVDDLAGLRGELGISRSLAEVLQNWPGPGKGVLIIDALDAARKFETQTVLKESVEQVVRLAGGRWNVIASVRKYDLRHGTDWRRAFQGEPMSNTIRDREFPYVRHLSIDRLSDQEIAQITAFSPQLNRLFLEANPLLKQLLRNIFNLHLLAELIAQGAVASDLITIRTQSELLDTYWQHRVRRNDGKHDVREAVLTTTIQEMVSRKSLRVFRADIRDKLNSDALVDLERNDILRAEEDARGANEDVLLFSHHVLFDYIAARLLFRRGRDPAHIVELLRSDRAMTLMVGPSLTMAFHDVWGSDPKRAPFWELAFAIAQEAALPQAAHLAAPMVAAESAVALNDLRPLLSWLDESNPRRTVAEGIMQHLIGAILVRHKSGVMLVGPCAGPWMEFAEALCALGTAAPMFAAKPLVAIGAETPGRLTSDQIGPAGLAARKLLEYGLSRQPRPSHLIIAAITAAAKTIASDVPATSRILRRLIEPAHLAEFGHEELRWLASQVRILAQHDLPLVVDIYQAAYAYQDERSDEKTNISNSAILSLTSNRRQDYQSAWYQLQEAAPQLLKEHPVEGARAIARAMGGFVERKHRSAADETPKAQPFTIRGRTAQYVADASFIWYRGGFHEPQDGPALLEKFEAFLSGLAVDANGASQLEHIIDELAGEAGLAVLWGSLLVAGAEDPATFAAIVAPLAAAIPVLTGPDTRHAVGRFVTAAYPHLNVAHREEIESAVLSVADDRIKRILAQCIPEALAATENMRKLHQAMRAGGEAPANTPPCQITTSSRPFDTDAYLRSQGVNTDGPVGRVIREAMRRVEGLPQDVQGPQITLDVAKARLTAINGLRTVLEKRPGGAADPVLYEHATGTLADAAMRTTLADDKVIGDAGMRRDLMAALLFSAKSDNPHFDAEVEADFHERASWGGPSARTAAARGLMCLVRFDSTPETTALDVIRRLARDSVCHVRLQVAENLHLLNRVDPEWMWAEYQHVLLNEPTRAVVSATLESLRRIAFLDLPRTVWLAKAVLSRYYQQSDPGMEACRATASSLIADIYIWTDNAEAQEFFSAQMADFPANTHLLTQWAFRYSGNLLIGSITDPADTNNRAREKSVGFYRSLLDASFSAAQQLWTAHDIAKSGSWPESGREKLREMFRVMDEITMRIYFAAGADNDGTTAATTPERTRFYREIKPLLENLADVMAVHVAHYLIQTLEALVPIDPPGVFELIARSVRASEKGGYTTESMAADVIVRIVERYLADHRDVFADRARLNDLMDCLDAFVRAGWPAAQALTFRLGEIWR